MSTLSGLGLYTVKNGGRLLQSECTACPWAPAYIFDSLCPCMGTSLETHRIKQLCVVQISQLLQAADVSCVDEFVLTLPLTCLLSQHVAVYAGETYRGSEQH